MPLIEVQVEDRHNASFPAHRMADVVVTTTDGRTLSSGDVHARGSLDAPLKESDVEAKFHNFAAQNIGDTRAASIWAMRHQLLEPSARLSDLATLVTGPAGE
jgi:2-methylcitrate dehydratase PrpD